MLAELNFTNTIMDDANISPSGTTFQEGVKAREGCLILASKPADFIPWDNPDNLISQKVPKVTDMVVGVICLPVLFLISATTNILSMAVFTRQSLRERINLCLFYLSLVDFVHMLHAFFCNVDRFYLPLLPEVAEFGPVLHFIVEYKLLGFRSLSWLSGFVSTVIACERCFCVVSPLRSQTVLTTRTMALILAFATVFCVTGIMVNGSRWSLPCVWDPVTSTNSHRLMTSQFYTSNRKHLDALSLFVATIQPATYQTVIITTTTIMAVKLRKMMAWRKQSSSGTISSREVALTRMLIAVSILYMVCSIPTISLGIGIMFIPGFNFSGRYYNLTMFFIDVMELASYVNATFNFFIYYSLGSKYKNTLDSLLHCRHLDSAVLKKDSKISMKPSV